MDDIMEVKVFNRWGVEGIKIHDPGLQDYISLEPKVVPRSHARYAKNRFHKSRIFIVERLINKLMVPGHKGKKHTKSSGHLTGKIGNAYSVVEEAFGIIEKKTKKNPVEVLVKAIENAAPREETVTIEYGGARYPKATECGPQRRIDLALKHMVQGTYARSFARKMSAPAALAQEIIDAYEFNGSSNAISKKNELERQSDASR